MAHDATTGGHFWTFKGTFQARGVPLEAQNKGCEAVCHRMFGMSTEEGSRRKAIDGTEFFGGTREMLGLTCNRLHCGSPEEEERFQLYYDVAGSLITKNPLHSVEGK